MVGEGLHGSYSLPELSPISRVWRVRKRLGAMEFGLPSRRRIITISSLVIFHPQTRAAEARSLSLLVSLLAPPRNLSEYSLSSHDEDERCVSDTITRRRLSRAPHFLCLSRVWLESPLIGEGSKRPTAFSTPPRSFCPVLPICLLSYFLAGKARGPHPHDHCSSVIIL